jgi:hypothetical protein
MITTGDTKAAWQPILTVQHVSDNHQRKESILEFFKYLLPAMGMEVMQYSNIIAIIHPL